jgi:DNA-nicking Smr family endonuclease
MVDEHNSKPVDEILGPQEDNRDSIDLHGLYEREAMDVVKYFLLENPARQMDVITGKGLHSEPGKGPVLQLTIQKLVDSKG